MEKYNLRNDVKVFCTTARSFPDGIQEAFMKIEQLLPGDNRTFYGISYKNTEGEIVFKAAISENFEGESKRYDFETFIIPKGEYLAETINWRENPEMIAKTFQQLLADPRLDKNFPRVEWYKNNDEVVCMVRVDGP